MVDAAAKSLLRVAAGIRVGEETLSLSPQTPDIDVLGLFPPPKDCVIVFDDLERCSIKLRDVMGYINSFVEHENIKVIIIANEDDIRNRQEYDEYKRIKEKLVGKTFAVNSNVPSVVKNFIVSIRDKNVRQFCENHVNDILTIHKSSQTSNLRIMKQAIWDFELLGECFDAEHWAKPEAILELFKVVLALSYEIRSGRITRDEEVAGIRSNRIASYMRSRRTEPVTPVDEMVERYSEVNFEQTLLNPLTISDLLFRGWVDKCKVIKEVGSSSYFASPLAEPSWKAALGIWRNSDEEVLAATERLEEDFRKRIFIEPGEFFQVFGTRLFPAEIDVINKDKTTIIGECKAYLDDLYAEKQVRNKLKEKAGLGDFPSWGGYSMVSVDSAEFKEIYKYYDQVLNQVIDDQMPIMATGFYH
jgi:hypothetical protein